MKDDVFVWPPGCVCAGVLDAFRCECGLALPTRSTATKEATFSLCSVCKLSASIIKLNKYKRQPNFSPPAAARGERERTTSRAINEIVQITAPAVSRDAGA